MLKSHEPNVGKEVTRWPDIQVELVVSKDLSPCPRRGRQREHAVLNAKVAAILEGVATSGSLSKAAKNMGISYSHASLLIAETEKSFGFSLTDGAARLGSTLTPKAAKLLSAYKSVLQESEEALEQSYKEKIGSAT